MNVFVDALELPLRSIRRVWWYWLILIPVVGWILVAGYLADAVRAFVQGKRELPAFGKLDETALIGVMMCIIGAVFWLAATLLLRIPYVGWIPALFVWLVMPLFLIHFAVRRTLDFVDDTPYLLRILGSRVLPFLGYHARALLLGVVLLIASLPIITLLITMPALAFGNAYLFAKFYAETVY
ncbi:MAG TPA: hypothetical protein VLJ21_03910 [Candidatus Binatia bacterium]|nr:hypothetical protein [Candidatus Binatia bacterium]